MTYFFFFFWPSYWLKLNAINLSSIEPSEFGHSVDWCGLWRIWGFLSLVSMWEGLELQTSEWTECGNSAMVRIITLYWTRPENRALVFPGTNTFVLVKLLCYRWDWGVGGWSKPPLPLLTPSPNDHASFPMCSVRTMYHLLCRALPPSLCALQVRHPTWRMGDKAGGEGMVGINRSEGLWVCFSSCLPGRCLGDPHAVSGKTELGEWGSSPSPLPRAWPLWCVLSAGGGW